jgi:hypothetical protein
MSTFAERRGQISSERFGALERGAKAAKHRGHGFTDSRYEEWSAWHRQ